MAHASPCRNRPNLHLSLKLVAGLPMSSLQSTPGTTPFSTTTHSPFRSAGPSTPASQRGPTQFVPRRSSSLFGRYGACKPRRLLGARAFLLGAVIFALIYWWSNGGREDLEVAKLRTSSMKAELFAPEITKNLQFYPASNPKIHYVGRWTSTPNRLRKDGTFPGVYFDLNILNTTTLLLSLRNSHVGATTSTVATSEVTARPSALVSAGHLSFHSAALSALAAPPISLLARVDMEEYILLPNSSSLVSVRRGDLDVNEKHNVRIIAPMTDNHGTGVVELEGIWVTKGAMLMRVEGSLLDEEVEYEDELNAENGNIGGKHRLGLSRLMRGRDQSKTVADVLDEEGEDGTRTDGGRRKVVEVVTDSPGFFARKSEGRRTGGADGLLAGVMGWEFLLGEMFGVDHVGISVEGMCLVSQCIGGAGEPFGMGDVFFRSGPKGSEYFERPWMFHAYVPDVVVLNLGDSDSASFDKHGAEYNISSWSLSQRFEDSYVSLIKAIRQLSYPKHPSTVYATSSSSTVDSPYLAAAPIPIFVMRPFLGQLEHAIQNVVNRLRADGDKSVFWLDTSGWLDPEDSKSDDRDFFLDESVAPVRRRLTERGNQRVAVFLHMHVCRYLAADEEKCAFLPPEVYQGKVFDPEAANFNRYLEDEKERKLKKLFWEEQ